MAKKYRVAVIAGDGIGKEVVPEALLSSRLRRRRYGFGEWTEFDWSCRFTPKPAG